VFNINRKTARGTQVAKKPAALYRVSPLFLATPRRPCNFSSSLTANHTNQTRLSQVKKEAAAACPLFKLCTAPAGCFQATRSINETHQTASCSTFRRPRAASPDPQIKTLPLALLRSSAAFSYFQKIPILLAFDSFDTWEWLFEWRAE
jgi:hypothetical protein